MSQFPSKHNPAAPYFLNVSQGICRRLLLHTLHSPCLIVLTEALKISLVLASHGIENTAACMPTIDLPSNMGQRPGGIFVATCAHDFSRQPGLRCMRSCRQMPRGRNDRSIDREEQPKRRRALAHMLAHTNVAGTSRSAWATCRGRYPPR